MVMIGMKMSSDVAYKLSQSWDRRYTSLRRVREEDIKAVNEAQLHLFPLGIFSNAQLQTR